MDATTTYAQATADFTADEVALFEQIDKADSDCRGAHTGALFGATLEMRYRNEHIHLPAAKTKLYALLDGLTAEQRTRWTQYRRTMREWRATA